MTGDDEATKRAAGEPIVAVGEILIGLRETLLTLVRRFVAPSQPVANRSAIGLAGNGSRHRDPRRSLAGRSSMQAR